MIHIVRKSTTRFTRFLSLVLIKLVFTEIQRFKNVKIYKEMYGIRTPCRTVSGLPYIPFEKYLKVNKRNSLHVTLKICSDICPWTLFVPRISQLKAVRFSEQRISADKYPSIFLRQMEAIVYTYNELNP